MASLTSANAIITLSVAGIFNTPIQLQGFSADNIYDTPENEIVQTAMGVDGILSGGFVFNPVDQTIELQADSASNDFFETWAAQMLAARDVYTAEGQTNLVALGRTYVMTKGFFVNFHQFAPAAKILQRRRYTLRWERIRGQPN